MQASESRSTIDPIRLPLLISRLVGGAFMTLSLLMGVGVMFLGFEVYERGLESAHFMLTIFGVVALAALSGAVAIYLVTRTFFREPIVYGIAASISYGLSAGALSFGFVGSVLAQSFVPYVALLLVTAVVWVMLWPRRRAWAKWSKPKTPAVHSHPDVPAPLSS